MDYGRIYREFIRDRRLREPKLSGYSEKHHIVPRCMGGTDSARNLIRLTPEDHFFAHLLLAKAHGGANWAALYGMCNLITKANAQGRSILHARMQFGHVRRALARYFSGILSGPNGKIADKRVHELRHTDGRVASGNRFALSEQTGVTRQQISALLRGVKKVAHGWYHPPHNPHGLTKSQLISENRRDPSIVHLFHHDGRTWSGTQLEFANTFGARLVFQHDEGEVRGWYRTRAHARAHGKLRKLALKRALAARGSIAGPANPNADPASYEFCVIATGEIITATKWQMRERFGISAPGMCSIFNGRQTQTRGIALAREPQDQGRTQYRMVRDVPSDSGRALRRPAVAHGRVHAGRLSRDL
jgi:hypothetical protein